MAGKQQTYPEDGVGDPAVLVLDEDRGLAATGLGTTVVDLHGGEQVRQRALLELLLVGGTQHQLPPGGGTGLHGAGGEGDGALRAQQLTHQSAAVAEDACVQLVLPACGEDDADVRPSELWELVHLQTDGAASCDAVGVVGA